jgi:multicomponent Na+:H+ antiporter subunit C
MTVYLVPLILIGVLTSTGVSLLLTAIVITMGIAAFVLALAYRSYRLTTAEEVSTDPEDRRVSQRSEDEADEDLVHPEPERDTGGPDELDALPAPGGQT